MYRQANLIRSITHFLSLGALTVLSTLSTHACAVVLDGSLGQWLKQQAGPELVKVLGNHPRFKGERLSVVSLHDGTPTTHSNQLSRALEEAVTQQLLRQSQVRVTWRQNHRHCGVQRAVPYLLGIEVSATSRNRAVVTIALVDVEENIWVPGVNLQWRGSLTRNEQRALQKSLSRSATGTIDRPLVASNAAAVSDQLFSQIQCALPKGVDQPVFVQADKGLQDIPAALKKRLAQSALFELTTKMESATWLIYLQQTSNSGDSARLDVVLNEVSNDGRQQLASLFVRGLQVAPSQPLAVPAVASTGPAATMPATTMPAATTPVAKELPAASSGPLLSELVHSDSGPCQHKPDQACASVELSVLRPAYLLVFRTQHGSISAVSCNARTIRSKALRRRYRVSVDPDATIGLYVLATNERSVARELQQHLMRAPGLCGTDSSSTADWLVRLSRSVAKAADAIEWRAIHLSDDAELKLADR